MLLLGLAFAALVVQGLVSGVVETPSSYAFFRSQAARADQPGLYWSLLLCYAVGAALFLGAAWRRYRSAADEDYEEPPPPPPRPTWARVLAWLGIVFGLALVGLAVVSHFVLDPIMSLPFVAFFGISGFFIALTSAGYLVTGRLQ